VTFTFSELLNLGVLQEGTVLVWKRKKEGSIHRATVTRTGIQTADGAIHKSPSGAAKHLNGDKPIDGWKCWRIESSNKLIDEFRTRQT